MAVPLAAEAEMVTLVQAVAVAVVEVEEDLQMVIRMGETALPLLRESLPRSPHQELQVAEAHLEMTTTTAMKIRKMRLTSRPAPHQSSSS